MVAQRDDTPPRSDNWDELQGLIAPEVLRAPRTWGDLTYRPNTQPLHPKITTYLRRTVAGTPWGDHLALLSAVLIAQKIDVLTVRTYLQTLHNRFERIFAALPLGSMEEWSVDVQMYMARYLRGDIVPGDSQATRSQFWILYNTSARHLTMWWKDLPACERPVYERYALPDATSPYLKRLAKKWEVVNDAKDRRKKETDAIIPHFAEICSPQAHVA